MRLGSGICYSWVAAGRWGAGALLKLLFCTVGRHSWAVCTVARWRRPRVAGARTTNLRKEAWKEMHGPPPGWLEKTKKEEAKSEWRGTPTW